MEIKQVGVLGAGTMGAGIAQVFAEAGLKVRLVDIDHNMLQAALEKIKSFWQKAVEKGKIDAATKAAREALLECSGDMSGFKDCELVIEAIVEEIGVKQKVFQAMANICPQKTILATNTSALSITEIAAATNRADRILGMHFFNPVPVMKLVEVIPGLGTSASTTQAVVELTRRIGKEPVIAQEAPGFLVNRILNPLVNEAALVFQEGRASAEEIDKAMKLGAGLPMGPLALADLIGLDVVLNVTEYLFKEFGESKYRPALVLKQKVRAGHLGVKTGKGFYDYTKL